MKTKWILMSLGVAVALASATGSLAQKKSSGEVKLVGIKLYDTGIRVVSVYGAPDEIEPVSVGVGQAGPAGARGPAAGGATSGIRPGGSGRKDASPGVPGRPGPGSSGSADWTEPGSFGDVLLQQQGKGGLSVGPGMAAAAPPPSSGGNGGGGNRGGGGPAGIGGGGGGTSGSASDVQFVRWVYRRAGSRYGFVLDRFSHVVQIEAVGLANSRVRTAKGITFGANFAQIIKKYGAPEGYDINGDTILIRYLVKNKVAFRLSRLADNKPQVVTGIAVAAGKA